MYFAQQLFVILVVFGSTLNVFGAPVNARQELPIAGTDDDKVMSVQVHNYPMIQAIEMQLLVAVLLFNGVSLNFTDLYVLSDCFSFTFCRGHRWIKIKS